MQANADTAAAQHLGHFAVEDGTAPPAPPLSAEEAGSLAQQLLERWYNDIPQFAWDCFGVILWRRQKDICEGMVRCARAVRTNKGKRRIAVKSGQKCGKSILIAVLALWWAVTRADGMVVLVAPTGNQIRNILWSEITTLYGKAIGRLADFGLSGGLGGQLNKVPDLGLQFGAKNWIVGRATNTPERMQGTSGENLLYLVDEASGVDIKIFEVVEGNTQGGGVIVMLGNPTQTSGPFYDAFNRNAHLYEQFSISSEETPNFKSKRVVVRGLATYDAILDRRKSWGGADYVNDPRYQIRVLGNFPTSAYNQVFSITDNVTAHRVWFAHAAEMLGRQHLLLKREHWPSIIQPGELERVRAKWESQDFPYPLRIGVDPAHEGDDLTTIYPRRGIHLYRPEVVKHGDGPVVAERVLEVARRHRRWNEKPVILIDAIGVGVSAYDVLKRSSEVTVIPINSYLAAADPVEFHNLRSELWFNARDWVRVLGGGWEPLPEQELENDLLSPLFAIDVAGRCEVEAKKKIKARIGHSPDHADGFNLAVYEQPNMFARVFDPTRQVKSSLRFGAAQRGF